MKMTEQEIVDIFYIINRWASEAVKNHKQDGASVYNPYNAKELAEALYNAGYRTIFTSSLASETQKAYKEGYINGFLQGQKSTIEDLVKFARDAEEQGYDGIGDIDIIEYADEFYGEAVQNDD